MTRDDIIRMAREAGSIDSEEVIETVWRAFSAAEREACARMVDHILKEGGGTYGSAIRAQAADRLARHGISIPEDDEYGNPSFG